MQTVLKPSLPNSNSSKKGKRAMPMAEILDNLDQIMDDVDTRYEAQKDCDPLAAGWQHMTEARGWK